MTCEESSLVNSDDSANPRPLDCERHCCMLDCIPIVVRGAFARIGVLESFTFDPDAESEDWTDVVERRSDNTLPSEQLGH